MGDLFYPACRAILQVVLDGYGNDDSDSDLLPIPILPRSCTVHKNSYREADAFELVFDAGDLPFDPRIIRTGDAEIYLFQTDGLGASTQVLSRAEPLAEPDAAALRPRTPAETIGLDAGLVQSRDRFTFNTKPLVAGLFDSASLELSSDGKWVSIKGQDYTALLAAIQWKPEPNGRARRVPVGKRIDLLFADLLGEADDSGKLAIDVRGLDPATLPIVGAEIGSAARGIPIEQNTTYWDIIYKTAQRYGLVAFVDGVDVVLTTPKTITGQTTSFKVLTWGKNLECLTLERDLSKVQVPTIVLQSFDPVARETITVEYPPGRLQHARDLVKTATKVRGTQKRATTTERHRAKPKHHSSTTPTERKRDEYLFADIAGVTDRKTLEQLAENYYRLKGSGERRVIAKTRDLKDMRASDMLNITAGDPVVIQWDEFNRELMNSPEIPDETKVAHLTDRGFNSEVARAVVKHLALLDGLDRPLSVKEVTYSFNVDDGIDIELELHDFVTLDGIRAGDGAAPPTRATQRASLVKHDGTPLGGTPEQRAALQGRYP